MVYSGWKVNSSTCTEIELNIYCHCAANVCVCKMFCSRSFSLIDFIFSGFFSCFFNDYSVQLFLVSLMDKTFLFSVEYHMNKITRAHTHTHKRARAHTLSRIETFHMSFAEKDPFIRWEQYVMGCVFFSFLPY